MQTKKKKEKKNLSGFRFSKEIQKMYILDTLKKKCSKNVKDNTFEKKCNTKERLEEGNYFLLNDFIEYFKLKGEN